MQIAQRIQLSNTIRLGCCLAIALLAVFVSPASGFQLLDPPLQPIDVATSAPIRTLLSTQWKLSRSNATLSQETFTNANSRDEFSLVAYAINRIHQNRNREAKEIVEELNVNFPSNLDGWMLKTWLNTLDDNFDVAIVSMRSFKKRIDAAKDLPDSTKMVIFKRLGKLVGYLQGPVAEQVSQDALGETTAIVTKGLAPDHLNAFNTSRDSVLKAHESLLKEHAAKTQVELVKVEAQNEQEKLSLERQNQILEQTESQLIPQKEQVEQNASNQISNLQQQASSVQSQLNAVSSDLQAAQLNLQYLYFDLDAIVRQQRRGYNVSTLFVRNQIRNTEYNIANMRNSGVQLSNQLNGTQYQFSQTQAQANQQIRNLDRELKRTKGSRLRNLSKLAKIAAGPELAGGKRNSMKQRARALPTYDEFPVELYRQQLLDHLTTN